MQINKPREIIDSLSKQIYIYAIFCFMASDVFR